LLRMIGVCADCRRNVREQKRTTGRGVVAGSAMGAAGRG